MNELGFRVRPAKLLHKQEQTVISRLAALEERQTRLEKDFVNLLLNLGEDPKYLSNGSC